MKKISRHERGFGLVDLVVCIAITSALGILISHLIGKPQITGLFLNNVDQRQRLYRALDVPVGDLKSADYASIQWGAISITNPGIDPTIMPWFHVFDPMSPSAPDSYICYRYNPNGGGLGTLFREWTITNPGGGPGSPLPNACTAVANVTGVSAETVVATDLLPPSLIRPLFAWTAGSTQILISLEYRPTRNIREQGIMGRLPLQVMRLAVVRT